jgi:hypothetical protein
MSLFENGCHHKKKENLQREKMIFLLASLLVVSGVLAVNVRDNSDIVANGKKQKQHISKSFPPRDNAPQDVLEFVEGIVWGLEVSFAGNLTSCVDDETTVLDDFADGYKLIKKGLEDFSPHDVEKGINQLGVGVITLREVFLQCGINTTLADLDHIAQLLQGGVVGIVEFIASEVLNILEHRVTLGTYLRLAVKAYDKAQYKVAGYETGRFLAVLIKDYPIN